MVLNKVYETDKLMGICGIFEAFLVYNTSPFSNWGSNHSYPARDVDWCSHRILAPPLFFVCFIFPVAICLASWPLSAWPLQFVTKKTSQFYRYCHHMKQWPAFSYSLTNGFKVYFWWFPSSELSRLSAKLDCKLITKAARALSRNTLPAGTLHFTVYLTKTIKNSMLSYCS